MLLFPGPYARRWQAIIEKLTQSSISTSTAKQLEEFQRIVSTTHRRAFVRAISLSVELEAYDEKARARFETDEERQRNNKIFTTTISTLFRSISHWPDDAGISLHIEAMFT